MQRIAIAFVILAMAITPCLAQQADADGDTIADTVEQELGAAPDHAEEFALQWHDGVIGDDDESVSNNHQEAPDFVDVYLANVAQDRWLWKITFADDYVGENNTFILYLDVDGDLTTGRQDAEWARGTDLMYVQANGEFNLTEHTKSLAQGPLRMMAVGDTMYVCADLPLGEGPGQPRFRVLSHVSPPQNSDSDPMEFHPVVLPERRDAEKPRIGPPPERAPVAELSTDEPDADGDGISDAVEEVLGMSSEHADSMHLIGEDGTKPGGDEDDTFEHANDIGKIYFGNAAGNRWIWRIDFAEEYDDSGGTLIILYLDCDNDRSTGRQDNGHVRGTDMMLTCNAGAFGRSIRNADVLAKDRDVRGVIDGNSIYFSMDLQLYHNEEGNTEYRAHVLSQQKVKGGGNDNTEWFTVCGPGESQRTKPRVGSLSEVLSDGVWVESPWLYWREQLREMDALHVDLAEADLEGMHLEDHAVVADEEGATATVTSPVAGDYHLNVVLQDSAERREEVQLRVDGETVATMVAADNDGLIHVFSTPEQVSLDEGTPIEFIADGPAQDARITELTLTEQMLEPQSLSLKNVTAFCPPAQSGDAVDVDICALTNMPCLTRVEWGRGDALNQTAGEERATYNHRVRLEDLERGATYSYRVIAGAGEGQVTGQTRTFVAEFPRPERCSVDRARIQLAVTDPLEDRPTWPVRGGVPIPEGHLRDAEHCRVLQGGEPVAADFTELGWWPDGSVKWLLVSLMHEGGEYVLEYGEGVARPEVPEPIRVEETSSGLRVTTDVLRADISRESFSPPGDIWRDIDGDGTFAADEQCISATDGAVLMDAKGNRYSTAGAPVERLVVEEEGPVRTVVLAEGHFAGDAGTSLGWRCRMYFIRGFAGVPTVFTLIGDRGEAVRPPTMTNIQSLDIPVQFPGDASSPSRRVLHDYENHYIVTEDGQSEEHSGHITPTGSLHSDSRGMTVALRDFWQTYPKAFSAEGRTVTAEIFPDLPADQYADEGLTPFERTRYYYWCRDGQYMVPMGVSLSYDMLFYALGEDQAINEHLADAWQQMPLLAAWPEHYCASGGFGDLEPEREGAFEHYQEWIDEGFERLEQRRQRVREYDWMNFGDTHGERWVNWTNQEYDLQWGLLLQFVRSGDWRFFDRAEEAARHTASVDTVSVAPNESVLGLQKAHCIGHVGGWDLERPEDAKYWFHAGIWNTGHMWSQGVMTTWCLTGDRRYLEAGRLLCDWFAREEARATHKWVHRAQGWSTIASLGGYHVIPHPWYLNAARLFTQNAIARQDPGTGTFIHPIGECEHEVKHMGGKAFMTGVVMTGLKMLDQVDPDPDVKNALTRSVDWLRWRMWVPEENGFQYAQCPQFDDRASGASTQTYEGLAYAYELTDAEIYREMLVRTMGDMILNHNPSGSGKGYAMQLRMTPFALSAMQRWGMTEMPAPPAPDPTVGMSDTVYLPADGPGLLALRVNNPSRQEIPAGLEITSLPDGLTADRSEVEWTAGGGVTLSPTIQLTGNGQGEIKLRYTAGETEGTLSARTRHARDLAIGEGLALLTGEGDPVAGALVQMGVELPTVAELTPQVLANYDALLVGSEAHYKDFGGLNSNWPLLLDFIDAGGRVAFIQLQDMTHEPAFLPLPLTLSNETTMLGEVVKPDHPLFADGAGLLGGCISYDSITSIDDDWTVLASDSNGNPSIVQAQAGGSVLVVQPSPDRYVIKRENPTGELTVEACEQLLRNVVQWLEGE